MPPFTRRICPETQELAEQLKYAIVSAISSGVPKGPLGTIPLIAFSAGSELPGVTSSVSVGPGAIALTVISFGPKSLARTRIICSIAPFVVK